MGNRSIGVAALGGMFIGTMLGLILVPGLYYLFSRKKQVVVVEKKNG
jgi:HAE1 family hydrophobic/amphiphilic exporter-1